MDIITYALCKKLAKAAVSGITNITVDGLTLIIQTQDGNILEMEFPTPDDNEYTSIICKSAPLVFDGVSVTYDLPEDMEDKDTPFNFYVNGIRLTEGKDYTVANGQITFDTVYDKTDNGLFTWIEGSLLKDNLHKEYYATKEDIDALFDEDGYLPINDLWANKEDIDKLFKEGWLPVTPNPDEINAILADWMTKEDVDKLFSSDEDEGGNS